MGLVGEVFELANLDSAFEAVLQSMKGGKNAPRAHPDRFRAKLIRYEREKPQILAEIVQRQNKEGLVRFSRFVTMIPKKPGGPAERPISLFSFEERIIFRSMLTILWPHLEPVIVPTVCYCTFRRGGLHPPRGIVEAVTMISRERKDKTLHIFETDIKGFFDSIGLDRLFNLICGLVPDHEFQRLVLAFLNAEVRIDPRYLEKRSLVSGAGIPQGSALSPLLACAFLSPFDKFVE